MMSEDVKTMRSDFLAEELRLWMISIGVTKGYRVLALLDEMERRLQEVENCICWGIDCVHDAKVLDTSYSHYTAAERAKQVFDDPNNYNHAPNLRVALKELIDAVQDRITKSFEPTRQGIW
jgi:hypothetical protein